MKAFSFRKKNKINLIITISILAIVLLGLIITITKPFKIQNLDKNGGVNTSRNYAIEWKDKHIESLVRANLNKQDGVIFKKDLDKITELEFTFKPLKDLSDLKHFENLIEFKAYSSSIVDISVLENNPKLETLAIESNALFDFSVLSKLTNLKSLGISNKKLGGYETEDGELESEKKPHKCIELMPISDLKNLENISIHSPKLEDIGFLEPLENLEKVSICSRPLENLDSLEKSTNLKALNLNKFSTPIFYGDGKLHINAISNHNNIESLSLYDIPRDDISMISGFEKLDFLSICDNTLTDLNDMKNLTNIKGFLVASQNLNDISGISNLTNLKNLYVFSPKIKASASLSSLKDTKIDIYPNTIALDEKINTDTSLLFKNFFDDL